MSVVWVLIGLLVYFGCLVFVNTHCPVKGGSVRMSAIAFALATVIDVLLVILVILVTALTR